MPSQTTDVTRRIHDAAFDWEYDERFPETSITEGADLLDDMNPMQMESLWRVIQSIWTDAAMGERHWDSYEIKQFKIKRQGESDSRCYSVYVIVGQKNDEGTLAEVLARSRLHVFIGKRGKLTHLRERKNGHGGYTFESHPRGWNLFRAWEK